MNIVFAQKFTRNAKNNLECLKIIWIFSIFAVFITHPLLNLFQFWEQSQDIDPILIYLVP